MKKLFAILLALIMMLTTVSAMAAAAPEKWDISKSKTATNLDANYESKVTLSLPSAATPTLQVTATMGTESIYAVAIPVTRLVAPGPDVARHTPTFPVALAYPSAAWDAPCSWDVRI